MPIAPALAADPSPAARAVRRMLWDILLTLEDLSPATASVMTLLAQMHAASSAAALVLGRSAGFKSEPSDGSGGSGEGANQDVKMEAGEEEWLQQQKDEEGLGRMVPRLWPFLRHGLTSVRLAAVRCLAALLRGTRGAPLLAGPEMVRGARLLFQNLLLERNAEVLAESQAAWRLLVRSRPAELLRADLLAAGTADSSAPLDVLGVLWQLASTPSGRTLAPALMLAVPPPVGKSSNASLALPKRSAGAAEDDAVAAAAGQHQQDSHVVGGDCDSGQVARMRLAAAQALGQLAHAFTLSGGVGSLVLPGSGETCQGRGTERVGAHNVCHSCCMSQCCHSRLWGGNPVDRVHGLAPAGAFKLPLSGCSF